MNGHRLARPTHHHCPGGWRPIARRRGGAGVAARILPGAALAALLACVGCTPQVTPEGRQLLEASRQAYDSGDDASAIRGTSEFLIAYGKTNMADVAYYLRGLAKYRQKDAAGAKADLELAAKTSTRKDVRTGAMKVLGDTAFDEGDMEGAESVYRQALAEAEPTSPATGEMQYRLGCVLQYKGRWAEADEQFDRVAHVFVGSEVARRAERRLRCQAWTVQAAAFSSKRAADAEAARLRGQGLSAWVAPAAGGGSLQFLVQVGRHETFPAAAAQLPAVRRVRQDAFVTPTR